MIHQADSGLDDPRMEYVEEMVKIEWETKERFGEPFEIRSRKVRGFVLVFSEFAEHI